MPLSRKDNNYNYSKFKSVSFYSNRLAAHSVMEKSCTVIHLICTARLPQSERFIYTLVQMGYLCNHHLFGKIPGLYQQSQYLFTQMISVFISTKKYSLVQIFFLHLPMILYSFWWTAIPFFLSVLVSALHNSLGC